MEPRIRSQPDKSQTVVIWLVAMAVFYSLFGTFYSAEYGPQHSAPVDCTVSKAETIFEHPDNGKAISKRSIAVRCDMSPPVFPKQIREYYKDDVYLFDRRKSYIYFDDVANATTVTDGDKFLCTVSWRKALPFALFGPVAAIQLNDCTLSVAKVHTK
jgi:hypothetical protein